jgi:tRNA(Glu) U13 pseudouridine synthase TruD
MLNHRLQPVEKFFVYDFATTVHAGLAVSIGMQNQNSRCHDLTETSIHHDNIQILPSKKSTKSSRKIALTSRRIFIVIRRMKFFACWKEILRSRT